MQLATIHGEVSARIRHGWGRHAHVSVQRPSQGTTRSTRRQHQGTRSRVEGARPRGCAMTDPPTNARNRSGGADNPAALARELISRGIAPVPIPASKKNPIIDGWQRLEITAENVDEYFDSGAQLNVGAIWGPKSGGLRDVDLDCIEAIKLAPHFLPRTNSIYGRASKRRSHYLYKGSDDP